MLFNRVEPVINQVRAQGFEEDSSHTISFLKGFRVSGQCTVSGPPAAERTWFLNMVLASFFSQVNQVRTNPWRGPDRAEGAAPERSLVDDLKKAFKLALI